MAWWHGLKKRAMDPGLSLDETRRRYAAEITRHSGARHARVEEAFATVPREKYLPPPPWTIFAPGGLCMTETVDPADLYQDVLVVLDRGRGINNGQPSLHAAWLAAVDPGHGDTIVHIGAGTGYYTALLAALVAPGGRVQAYEIEPGLATLARGSLAHLEGVTLHASSGVGAALPPADVVYVNASASAPDPAWLDALKPHGRLVFPWQPSAAQGGVTMLVTRRGRGFRVVPTMEVAFIACVGAMAPPADGGPAEVRAALAARSLWLTAERAPDETAVLIYERVWFSREPVPENGP